MTNEEGKLKDLERDTVCTKKTTLLGGKRDQTKSQTSGVQEHIGGRNNAQISVDRTHQLSQNL
jgi:hypothetical protein